MMLSKTPDPVYEEIARSAATPRELECHDNLPIRLPYLSLPDLLEVGANSARCARDMNELLAEEMLEDEPDLALMEQALRAEYLHVGACCMIADEIERRRTGIAPRAKHMN